MEGVSATVAKKDRRRKSTAKFHKEQVPISKNRNRNLLHMSQYVDLQSVQTSWKIGSCHSSTRAAEEALAMLEI